MCGKSKYTSESFIKYAKEKHGEKYNYSLVDFKNMENEVIIICPEHGEFKQRPCLHLRGSGCFICAKNKIKLKQKRIDNFIEKCYLRHGDRFDFSLSEYKGIYSDIKVICKEHGEFYANASKFLKSNPCEECKKKYKKSTAKLILKKEFLDKMLELNSKYNYSLMNKEIYKFHEIIEIICPEHGKFKQRLSEHYKGHRCEKCTTTENNKKKILDQNILIKKVIEKHGDKFDFSKVNYTRHNKKVIVICKKHGEFQVCLKNLINKKNGCIKCYEEERVKVFIEKLKKIYGEIYNYSKIELLKRDRKVPIICSKHGEILVKPTILLYGTGCPECHINQGQESLYKFINKYQKGCISSNNRKIIPPYEIDIYLDVLKLGFEYNGNFWHSSDRITNTRHYEKCQKCANKQIKLINIFEDNWLKKRQIFENFIRNLFFCNENIFSAFNCEVKLLNNLESKQFVEENSLFRIHNLTDLNIGIYKFNQLISIYCLEIINNKCILHELVERKDILLMNSINFIKGFIFNKFENILEIEHCLDLCLFYKFEEFLLSGFSKIEHIEPKLISTYTKFKTYDCGHIKLSCKKV